MRVVDVTSFFSASCGGIKTYYREKARHLPALGVDCHFLVPGARDEEAAFGGGTLHRLAGPPMPGNRQYRLFGSPRALGARLRALAPDVVEIASHYFLPGMVEAAFAAGPRPALVGFFHSDVVRALVEPAVSRLPGPARRAAVAGAWRFVRRQHQRYDATLVAARALAPVLTAQGVPGVHWVGLGVDVDVFRPQAAVATKAPTLVYAGRMSADKHFGLVLDSFDRIHAATGARLRIFGAGPAEVAAARFARTRPAVALEGYLDDRAALAGAIATADLVLTPGPHETFSLATAEALACATPVLAPDRGAAGDLVAESGGGARFAAGSAASLAETAIGWLARPAHERRARSLGARAYVIAHFTWPAVAQRLHAVYAQVAGQRRSARLAA